MSAEDIYIASVIAILGRKVSLAEITFMCECFERNMSAEGCAEIIADCETRKTT